MNISNNQARLSSAEMPRAREVRLESGQALTSRTELFSEYNVGDIITGRVVSSGNGQSTLLLSNGALVNASSPPLAEGDIISLELASKTGRQVVLTLITEENKSASQNAEGALNRAGVQASDKNVAIAAELQNRGIPVDTTTLMRANDLLSRFPALTPKQAVFLLANYINADESTVAALSTLSQSKTGVMLDGVERALATLPPDTISALYDAFTSYPAGQQDAAAPSPLSAETMQTQPPGTPEPAQSPVSLQNAISLQNTVSPQSDISSSETAQTPQTSSTSQPSTEPVLNQTSAPQVTSSAQSTSAQMPTNTQSPGTQSPTTTQNPGTESPTTTQNLGTRTPANTQISGTQSPAIAQSTDQQAPATSQSTATQSAANAAPQTAGFEPETIASPANTATRAETAQPRMEPNLPRPAGQEAYVPRIRVVSDGATYGLSREPAIWDAPGRTRESGALADGLRPFTMPESTVFRQSPTLATDVRQNPAQGDAERANVVASRQSMDQQIDSRTPEAALRTPVPDTAIVSPSSPKTLNADAELPPGAAGRGESEPLNLLTSRVRGLAANVDAGAEAGGESIRKAASELGPRLEAMRDVAEARSSGGILSQLDQLVSHIKLQQDIQQFVYAQVPFRMGENTQTAELYVLKRNSRALDEENANLLVALDMEHMGRIEALIQVQKKDIRLRMRIGDEDAMPFIKQGTVDLHERLREIGYYLADMQVMAIKTPVDPLNVEQVLRDEYMLRPKVAAGGPMLDVEI